MKRMLISNGNPMEKIVGFSRAVRVGPYISVGGTAPVDHEGRTVGINDPIIQTHRCLIYPGSLFLDMCRPVILVYVYIYIYT